MAGVDFDTIDTNGDGVISRAEFEAFTTEAARETAESRLSRDVETQRTAPKPTSQRKGAVGAPRGG